MRLDVTTTTAAAALSREGEAPRFRKQGRRSGFVAQFVRTLVVAALACASYFFISHFCVQSVRVVGLSMAPTLHDSDLYLLNRWICYFRHPQRSEIVVLRDPIDNGFSVKRVIARAGETVAIREGSIYVNGRKLEESYLRPGTRTYPNGGAKEQSFLCGARQYFVLGDNRMNSADSRTYGPVPQDRILGIVIR